MPAITIRDVPQEARDVLAARAAREGRSLQEYLRLHLTDLANRPDRGELLDRIEQRLSTTGSTLAVGDILEHRDQDRR